MSSLVIISFVPIVKWAIWPVTRKWVLRDVVPPSDDVVNRLAGADYFYSFLLQVLIGEGCSSSHYFFQDLPGQAMEKELMGLGIPCLVPCLSC